MSKKPCKGCGSSTTAHRRVITPAMMLTAAQAILANRRVTPEVQQARMAICARCPHLKQNNIGGYRWCGICGCKVHGNKGGLLNLAAHKENLPKWGCKFPGREEGKGGWPWPPDSIQPDVGGATGPVQDLTGSKTPPVVEATGA